MSIGDRIKKLRSEKGYSQTEFAAKLQLSQSVLSLIEADRSSLTIDTIRKISELCGINSHWLIYGQPAFLKELDPESFIPLVKGQRVNTYLEDRKKSTEEQNWPFFSIPGFKGGEFKIFENQGDSMSPALCAGDLMVCRKEELKPPYRNGSVYLCITSDELLLRRIYVAEDGGDVTLIGDNSSFDPITLKLGEVDEAWRVISRMSGSFENQLSAKSLRLERMENAVDDLWKTFEHVSGRLPSREA